MILRIIRPSPKASPLLKAMFAHIAPGSVAVLLDTYPNSRSVYYEGGIYTRPRDRKPTQKERKGYAVIAASRAVENYPTVAQFTLPQILEEELVTDGFVDTTDWTVELSPEET